MPYSPEKRKLYDATRAPRPSHDNRPRPSRSRPYKYRKRPPRPFIGFDGEGGLNSEGKHEYYLLRGGDRYISGNPLRTVDCLRFLYSFAHESVIPVAFFFDYDVTMMLQDVPRAMLELLYDRQARTVYHAKNETVTPIRWNGWEFDHMPKKEFKCRPVGSQKWFTVSDVSGFYQCSFLEAITTWKVGTPEDHARIAEGKAGRSEYTNVLDPTEIEYNRIECSLLALLLERLRDTCEALALVPPKWQGAGNLATSMMKANNAPEKPELPQIIRDAAQAAYYGGRFELSMHGMFNGIIHEYDIASAYPDAMRKLICLEHGYWKAGTGTIYTVGVYSVTWSARGTDLTWGPFPFRRSDGTIHYPLAGHGWYWGPEVKAMIASGQFDYEIGQSYEFVRECQEEPFHFIEPMYQERQALGKSDKGKILKLGLNSLYGKTAQSIGKPKYANPVFAGLITSITRARMSELCFKNGNKIVMIATDGIYSTEPLGIEADNPDLGVWEHETFEGMLFIQPGLYWSGDVVHSKTRTRGVAKSLVTEKIDVLIQEWITKKWDGAVTFTFTRFYGLRETLHLKRPELAGQWLTVDRTVSYAANDSKRIPIRKGDVWRSKPHPGSVDESSAPYKKMIGGMGYVEHPEYITNELYTYPSDLVGWTTVVSSSRARDTDFLGDTENGSDGDS